MRKLSLVETNNGAAATTLSFSKPPAGIKNGVDRRGERHWSVVYKRK